MVKDSTVAPRQQRNPASRSTEVARLIYSEGGYPVATKWFYPASAPRGIVVIAPAMATPGRFYHPLANFLADEGYVAVTFDYRGMEAGAAMRTVVADLFAWAADAAAVLGAADEERTGLGSGVPLTWVGHSFGGQLIGLIGATEVQRFVLVGSGHGYWRYNSLPLRRWVRAFWHVVVPLSVRIYGFYPGRRLRFLGDLPAGVIEQWRRWCLHPGYWEADLADIRSRHAASTASVTAIHMSDDQVVSVEGVEALLSQLTGATTECLVLAPSDLGSSRVGHHGFFRPKHASTWAAVLLPRLACANGRSPFAHKVRSHPQEIAS